MRDAKRSWKKPGVASVCPVGVVVLMAILGVSGCPMPGDGAGSGATTPGGVDSGGTTQHVSSPQFNPAGGTYSSDQTITVDCATSGATVHYTLDGSVPTVSSPTYSVPIPISGDGVSKTIKAYATKSGMSDSAVASATYDVNYLQVSTPQFSPAAGTYSSDLTVTISCATSGATVYYTTDGSAPTTSSSVFSAPITVGGNGTSKTIRALAAKSGMANSGNASATYAVNYLQVSTPQISPAAGTYSSDQAVTISCATPGATVYYTTDGTTPTTSSAAYGAPIAVAGNGTSKTIQAFAVKSGLTDSGVASAAYTINYLQASTPQFIPAGGNYGSPQSISISSSTAGASIRFTTDGGAPSETNGTLYTSPVLLSSNVTLKAIAYKAGMTDSTMASATYAFVVPGSPTISTAVGGIGQVTVTWGAVSGATSYNLYWAQGMSVSTASGTKASPVTSPQVISGLANGTTYAFIVTAVDSYGESAPSPVITATTFAQASTPQFSPAGGSYLASQTVTITCATGGATIRYTTDGSAPNETSGTVYGSPISISNNCTLKAMAYRSGLADSALASSAYAFVPPASPTISGAVAASGQVSVGWGMVSGATSYNLYWAQGATVDTSSGTKISFALPSQVVSGLTNGTQYAFIVTAVNAYGESAPSFVVTATTPPPQWMTVGSAGLSAGQADEISMAIDFAGTPYVAYRDYANGSRATVMKYSGSTWVPVGSPGFSANQVNYSSLALYNGAPYVAYDQPSGSAQVAMYDGASWVTVGGAGFCSNGAGYISLAIDSGGVPWVAFSDGARVGKTTVMKYNGSSWVVVGSAGFSAGQIAYTSLAIDASGTPYVAYSDYGNSYKAIVMKYNGSTWVSVGSSTGMSAGEADYTSLAIAPDGSPCIAYMDCASNAHATVMRYNGSAWVPVGSAGFSAGQVFYTSLAVDSSGVPYVAYRDNFSSYKAIVAKYSGGTWASLGGGGLSGAQADFISLALHGGMPYVAYEDYSNSEKATVRVFK